uniref:Calsyntenin 2 n=1 Tax=Pavo cristatus TaxID=9049 RepID=A0A8C9FNI1_PAVCR
FKESMYKATVTEGKIYDSILQVEAIDEDCSPQYSQICNYEIVTTDVPFAIDRNGNIRNTEKLNYDKQRRYEIMVTAFDCGQKHAREDVLVQVNVKPVCKPGWQDWNKRIEYKPGSGSIPLFPSIHLETCDGPVSSTHTTIELQTNHIGKGCDRETYSEKSLQKLCGASSGAIDLLPSPSATTNWTAGLLMDNNDIIFKFDGKQGAKIPDGIVPKNLTDQFTISLWMKHGPSPGLRAEKETILCNSDKTEMNRHHYALYVHNCRLVFLLRKDFDQADTFRPAEFHWKLDQICDKEWHYYVVNVEFPVVTLYMDGTTYEPYLVTNDWPIHPSHIAMQLTVGACWQGNMNENEPRFAQYFHGSLASLTIRPGKIESQKVISCLQACKEGLDINSLESLGQGVKYHFNPSQSVLVMEGDDIENINRALRKVSYINSRQFPTAGVRRLKVSSKVQCFGEDVCINIPDIDAYVMVLQANEPKITISGMDHFARPAAQFESERGVILLPDIRIVSTVTKTEHSKKNDGANKPVVLEEMLHDLDFCDVLVSGAELDPEQECLELDRTELQGKHLDATNSTAGYSIYGADTMHNYEQVLQQIRYRNWYTSATFERKFRIKCSELNGHYTSNEFNLEVNILHSTNSNYMDHVNKVIVQPQFLQSIHHPEESISTVHNSDINLLPFRLFVSVVPSVATVVIVICVSVLIFIIAVGVYRIRTAQQHSSTDNESSKENEMDWDDSALTITVNPMEKYEKPHRAEEESEEEDEEEEDTTSAESDESEEEDDEEEEEEAIVQKRGKQNLTRQEQLEWDDSTLPY